MRNDYFPSEENNSSNATLLYSLYTLIKILILIGILASDDTQCQNPIVVLLILYVFTESYELLFILLLALSRRCMVSSISGLAVKTGQASYECFRLIITIALSINIFTDSDCISSRIGTIALILSVFGILKYSLFIFLCICCYSSVRNYFLLPRETRVSPISEHELREFIIKEELLESCSICIEETNNGMECVKLSCSHVFHHECLKGWATIKGLCPICRQRIVK